MKLSVEILDHIFSFVESRRALMACSADPVLGPIVERHRYHNTTLHFGDGWSDCDLIPDWLSQLVSENPRILNYVRVLDIQVQFDRTRKQEQVIKKQLDDFANTLLMFPLLECIMLTTPKNRIWHWPDVFRAALKDRLNLPTVKDVQFEGNQEFPFSLIGNCKNIENLILMGSFEDAEEVDSTPLQLKSLALSHHSSPELVNLHIKQLQSLKCAESAVDDLSELLEVCFETLNKLDIDLTYSSYSTTYTFPTGKVNNHPFMELSPIPPNLQQLIIRASVCMESELDEDSCWTPKRCESYLQASAEIISLFVSPPQHLVLDINIHLFSISSNLANVDFSPLAALGPAAMSIPRIDLYVHTGILSASATLAQIMSALADYEDIIRSVEKGILIIHSEKSAPDYYVEDYLGITSHLTSPDF